MKNKNDSFIGLRVLGFGIIFVLICIMYFGTNTNTQTSYNQTKASKIKEKSEYVYYNVPTYTTIYEIVYPDWRYTVVHHSPSKLSSFRGTNFLYSEQYNPNLWGDRNCPKYWKKEWNKNELSVETTAPIRIVSETVSYKKFKYKIK